MKINDIAKEIARREGKKSQARMGDIKEILGILSDLIIEAKSEHDFINKVVLSLSVLGLKRYKKKIAKKRSKKKVDKE